jgi:cytochrome c-type biogenesis protein
MRRALLFFLLPLAACQSDRFTGRIGENVPAYAASTLTGDSLSLPQLRGEVVLLNVWATWCIPCRKELPELEALHKQYEGQGLRVLAVSVDEGGSDADVRDFAKEFGLTFTILRDPNERVFTAFSVIGVPASFLIDREGKLAWKKAGPFTIKDAELQRALQNAL